jgi:hypothetical protein
MAADSPPAGGGNQGQAGGSASSAVERVDGPSAPTGGASGIDLAFETKTSVVSPRHANSEQTDDASALAKGLLDVTLVPETTVQSVPDVTSSPPVDQEVLTNSHLTPLGFSLDPPSGFALADVLVEASPNPLGYRTRSPWDRLTNVSTYGPSGSEEDDMPDLCWDFSGLGNPSAMRDFMTACDYCLSDCSDGSRSLGDEDCGPSREYFHVDLGGPPEGNHLGMPEDGDLPRSVPRVDILRELAVVPVPAGGHDPQLEQIRGVQARLDEGTGALEPIRRDVGQEWAGQPPAGEMRHLPQGIQHRIADDVRVRPPPASTGVGQNLAAAAMLLRVMPEPSTTEGRRIQGELKNLLEGAAVRRAESSASRRQGYPSEPHAATFPIHAGSLGPHRAHAQHSACGPGSPRQRAPSPRPSGPPRREGAPRLSPQAWGTLRQRGGSESLARTTRSAGLQLGHTTGAVPDPVLTPGYYHKVLGGDETGAVARGLPAGLPTGWNGR